MMKIAAIIAEYNPFHNGHSYQISETRRTAGADYVLVIMSGNFVQRGAPAICNKYIRTRMALLGGADAVIELPSLYALSSAEFFAQGAVTLIDQLGCVELLSFGSECGDLSLLLEVAFCLLHEDGIFKSALDEALKSGYSFPAARINALKTALSVAEKNADVPQPSSRDSEALTALLSSPNNILGIEYCKSLLALKSRITPYTIKRQGNAYHDAFLSEDGGHYPSASALRSQLASDRNKLSTYIPTESFRVFSEEINASSPITEEDFSQLLHYKLLTGQETGFSGYLDCTPDLSAKICNALPTYKGFADFCNSLKSKDLTYTRISRTLFHILLNLETPDFYRKPFTERELFVPYARLLGFRKCAGPLLKAIKQSSHIPLLSKPADAKTILSEDAYSFFKKDLYCADVYETALCAKNGKTALNEFRQSPIIIP